MADKSEAEAAMLSPGSSFQLQANGLGFKCRIDGRRQGPWLVFSNSLATGLSMWDEQVAALGNEFRILRYDQRGHGGTAVPSTPCTFDQLVDDVLAIFDAIGIDRATLLGVSMGAITALRFAALHPQRLDRVIACDGPWVNPAGAVELWEERIAVARSQGMQALVQPTVQRWFRAAFVAGNPPVLDKVRRMIADTPAEGFIACARALQQFDFRQSFPQIRVPTLLLCGAADGATPQVMREMHAAMGGSTFVEIPEAGHLPNLENPEEFQRAFAAWIR